MARSQQPQETSEPQSTSNSTEIVDPSKVSVPFIERPEAQEFLGHAPEDLNRDMAPWYLQPALTRPPYDGGGAPPPSKIEPPRKIVPRAGGISWRAIPNTEESSR
ncbi:MAG: hypothetical protein J2P48_17570 [Alphaproteobacteria bacterium]|nr:hypothetical protein [Alphaproteobacteria bacterium]